MIQDSVQSGFVPELVRAVPLFVKATSQYTQRIQRGWHRRQEHLDSKGVATSFAGSTSDPRNTPALHVHCPTEAHWYLMVKNVLKQPRSWRPRKVQCPRITSQMRPGKRFTTQSVLKSSLETPEPHVRGRTSMLHTIELIIETYVTMPDCTFCIGS